MSEEKNPPKYDWAESIFRAAPDVAPKHRDLLAMLAATMMGNPEAAGHFYNRAVVDGASDEELGRMIEIARGPNAEIANFLHNMATPEGNGGLAAKGKSDQENLD